MTGFRKSTIFLALLGVAGLAAQAKKPIPSNSSVDKASEVIDNIINTKDTVQPVKREETNTSTTTTTTTTTTVKPATTSTSPASTSTTTTAPTSTTTVKPAAASTAPSSTAPASTSTAPATSSPTAVPASIQPSGKSALFVNSKQTFELLPVDDLSSVDYVEYKINDGDYVKYTGPITLGKEGPATIAYRAIDKVGNRENTQVLSVIVDNTPPTAALKPVEALFTDAKGTLYASNKNTYAITAEDGAAGVKEISYNVDNEPKQKYSGQPLKLEKPGFHVINYFATDNAGNSSPESSFLVNVDGVKPNVDITESIPFVKVNEKTFARKDTTFKVTAKDGESGISKILVKIDGAAEFTPYVEDIVFTTSGEHSIEAKAIDNVGNESDVKKVVFLYDIKAPITTIKAVSN